MAIQNNIADTERLIYIDDLTGLFNRRYLYYQLPKDLRAAGSQNYEVWLFMLDIDNFKLINDSYGHLYGDEILRGVANILKENIKADDKKIRYAGDEFTIIVSKLEAKNVPNVAQRLMTKISSHPFIEKHSGKEISITVSLGIAGFPQDTADPRELIDLADKSLYISKQKGKSCVSFASEITPELFWKKDILERFPCSILVERENEFSRLKDALDKIEESEVKMLLFSGELGIGKSRLLNEFERFVSSAPYISLAAKCEEKHLIQPYYILGCALYRYLSGLDKLPEEILQGISDSEVAVLFSFMPIMKDMYPDLSLKEVAAQEKNYLNEGLIKFLFNLSKLRPLCFLFDDFHCVDSQSLEVILRLIRENKGIPILVIATYSGDEITGSELGLSSLVSAMKEETFTKYSESFTLNRLSPEGTHEMISHIFSGIPFSPEIPGLIYKITKGNPLFIEVLLKYIIEKEYIFYQKGNWIQKEINEAALPSSIEETIRARIEGLSPETKEMIAKAAVIGEDFQIDMLQKIDSEDRGYILDLIEAAKKVGLIYESGTLGRDEYSFVTGEIRKVLFKIIGDNRTKHLYSRLGEIKEKLYPDKLTSVAGELYYNFKKAQDLVRAEQYAKIVKEGRATFYDQTIRYAQALLEEAVEEKVALPLSKEALRVIPEIIRYVYISTVNYILYPAQSQVRLTSIEELYKRLSCVLAETEILNIAYVEHTIIVNNRKMGKELKSFFLDAFISLFKNLNIESITFKKELQLQELSTFMEIISSTEEKEEALSELLEKSAVDNIQINEITYDILKKKSKERESLEEIMLIDYLLGKLPSFEDKKIDLPKTFATHAGEISQALEKLGEQASKKSGKDKESIKAEIMAKSIQRMESQLLEKGKDDWTKYKKGLAQTILFMEPNLRANIFASQVEEEGKEKYDIIKELSLEIPDEVIIDVLTRQYLQKDTDLQKMKRLTQRFLSSPAKKEKLTPLLKEKFKRIGATEEECDWLFEDKGWEKFSLEEKVDKILILPIKTLLKILPIIKIQMVIKELLTSQQEAKVEAVLERLIRPLEEKFPESQILVGYLKEILGIFIQDSKEKLLPKLVNRLLKMVSFNPKEFSSLFFSILNPYLEKVIQIFLDAQRFILTKEIIKIYTKDEKNMESVSEIFKRITSKSIEEVIRRIDINLDWTDLTEILILLKDYSIQPLIEEALFERGIPQGEYFEAYLMRFTIAKVLKQMPKEAFLNIVKEKFSDSRLFIVKNLIELIRATEDEQLIQTLEIPLKHPDVGVRKKVIFVLSKIRGKEGARLLGEALKDKDENIRKDALRILKSRTDAFALEILKGYPKDTNLG